MAFKDSPEINLILNSLKNDDFDCGEIENPYTLLSESIQNLKEYYSNGDLKSFLKSMKMINDILETVDKDFTEIIQDTEFYKIFEELLFSNDDSTLVTISFKVLRNCILVNPIFTDIFIADGILPKIYEIVKPPLSYSIASALEVLMCIIYDHNELASEVLQNIKLDVILDLLHSIGSGLIKMTNKISRTVAKFVNFFVKHSNSLSNDVIDQINDIIRFVLSLEFEGTDIIIDSLTYLLENGLYNLESYFNEGLDTLIINVLSSKNSADVESISKLYDYLIENGLPIDKFPIENFITAISSIIDTPSKVNLINCLYHFLSKTGNENTEILSALLDMNIVGILSSLVNSDEKSEEDDNDVDNEEEDTHISFISSKTGVTYDLLKSIITFIILFISELDTDTISNLVNDSLINTLIEGLNVDETRRSLLEVLSKIVDILTIQGKLDLFIGLFEQNDGPSILSTIEPIDEDEESALEAFLQKINQPN